VHIYLAGLNHRTAPIELRERLAYSDASLPSALNALTSRPGVSEAAILSTCNRTELYALCSDPAREGYLLRYLSESHSVPISELAGHCYQYQDGEAAAHLLRVTCGLDSLVLGEPQILGQVKDAFAVAVQCTSIGPVLNGLFRAAIATGKRARTETDIGKGGFSIGHAAVDLAKAIFGDLEASKVLILGAGKMSELTAKHLLATGIHVVFVANRTLDKATAMANRLGGKAIRYDEFPQMLEAADIVISSTAAPNHILTCDSIQPALKNRRGRPLFLIDIAMPRDIDPAVAELDNVFLYDIDDLESVVEDMAKGREAERPKVELIIQDAMAEFMSWLRSLEAAPIISQLKQKHEEIRQTELARLRNQLPNMTTEAWERIELATKSMVNRIGKQPIERLKESASARDEKLSGSLLDAAYDLFGLTPEMSPKGECETGEQTSIAPADVDSSIVRTNRSRCVESQAISVNSEAHP
jgi:glutamyl-tRNA reductase